MTSNALVNDPRRRRAKVISVASSVVLSVMCSLAWGIAGDYKPEVQKDAAQKEKARKDRATAARMKKSGSPSAGQSAVLPRPKGPINLRRVVDEETGKEYFVVNNEDLRRIYGPARIRAGAGTKSNETTAIPSYVSPKSGTMPQNSEKNVDRAAQLEEELLRLRKRLMSLHNPYLPRVAPDEKEKKAEAGLDNAKRAEMTRRRIAEVEAEIRKLQGSSARSSR